MAPKRKNSPVELLGTTLEGGGQLFRIAVGLSALSSIPIKVTHIRGNRSRGGGLKLQHLRAVEWLAGASGVDLDGAEKGSKVLDMLTHVSFIFLFVALTLVLLGQSVGFLVNIKS
jgi:RNA 3'-terminal phosphate cyclase (ATP)